MPSERVIALLTGMVDLELLSSDEVADIPGLEVAPEEAAPAEAPPAVEQAPAELRSFFPTMSLKFHQAAVGASSDKGIVIGHVEGFASVFGARDNANEVVHHGAFKSSIAQTQKFPIFWGHQHEGNKNRDSTLPPIGVTTSVIETPEGLVFKADLLDTPRGRECATCLEAGALSKSSIGFNMTRAGLSRDRSGVLHIVKAELREISIVNFPEQPGAQITGGLKGTFAKRSEADIFASALQRFAGG